MGNQFFKEKPSLHFSFRYVCAQYTHNKSTFLLDDIRTQYLLFITFNKEK